ncbi:MAG: phosphoribosylformylglycinamidine synthase subunit PurS [bacterium]|jgi:phosphoribosylformylglycinamidine synthase
MPKAKVHVYLKEGILDPQGQAIRSILESMDFNEINEVRVGKTITLEFPSSVSVEQSTRQTEEICGKILVNPVIEDCHFEISPD